jgi:hypothetical protein
MIPLNGAERMPVRNRRALAALFNFAVFKVKFLLFIQFFTYYNKEDAMSEK